MKILKIVSVILYISLPNILLAEASELKPSMNMVKDKAETGSRDPNANSGGYEYTGMRGWEETDEMSIGKIIFDQLEYRDGNGTSLTRWDMQGWLGTDYEKLWIKFEGEDDNAFNGGEFEFQALYDKASSAFWDLQYGIRYDRAYGSGPNKERYFGVIGVQGLAPYWFEVESSVYIDKNANISARLVASYDMLFSQRLILQPRLELNASANDVPDFGVGQGINDLQLGIRLRYEFEREIAPYIGFRWQRQFGGTADYTLQEGNSTEFTEVILGIRVWF